MQPNSSYLSEITFVRILLPFALGILFSSNCQNPGLLGITTGTCLMLLVYLQVVNLSYKALNIYHYKGFNGVITHILLFSIGNLCFISYNDILNTDYYYFKESKYLKLHVENEPTTSYNTLRFKARVVAAYESQPNNTKHNSIQVTGKILVAIKTDSIAPISLRYGDELIIPTRVAAIEASQNPAEFDFKFWLAMQNIHHQTFLKQHEVVKQGIKNENKLIAYALELRKQQVNVYRRLLKNDDAFAVASTLILGYRSELNKETLDIYAKTGTIHALSVSGMHVGLIYLVLNLLLSALDSNKRLKIVKTLLILILIWFYTVLTGLSASVLRSAIMLSVFIIAKLFHKSTNSYNIIAFAAFCLLIYQPFLIWDVGFQLSFLAVFGLIALQPKIQSWIPLKQPWLQKIWSAAAMSIAAQLATYPLSVYYFHQFPLCFLLSNLFIMIPIALIMYLGILTLFFKLHALGLILEWLISFCNNGLEWIAALPFSGISAIWISKTELVWLSLSLLLFVMAMNAYQKRLLFLSLISFLCLQSLISYDKIQAMHQKKNDSV